LSKPKKPGSRRRGQNLPLYGEGHLKSLYSYRRRFRLSILMQSLGQALSLKITNLLDSLPLFLRVLIGLLLRFRLGRFLSSRGDLPGFNPVKFRLLTDPVFQPLQYTLKGGILPWFIGLGKLCQGETTLSSKISPKFGAFLVL